MSASKPQTKPKLKIQAPKKELLTHQALELEQAAKEAEEKAANDKEIVVDVHDFHQTRQELIRISSGKDRRRLEYIVNYESHKLKKQDRHKLQALIKTFPTLQKEELERKMKPEELN